MVFTRRSKKLAMTSASASASTGDIVLAVDKIPGESDESQYGSQSESEPEVHASSACSDIQGQYEYTSAHQQTGTGIGTRTNSITHAHTLTNAPNAKGKGTSEADGRQDSDLLDMDSSSGSSTSSAPENINGRKGSTDSLDVFSDLPGDNGDDDGDGDGRGGPGGSGAAAAGGSSSSSAGGEHETQHQRRKRSRIIMVIILSALLPVGKAFVEGCAYVAFYRTHFGNKSPIPFSPMHGVAVAVGKSNDADFNADEDADGIRNKPIINDAYLNKIGEYKNHSSLAMFSGYQFNSFADVNSEDELNILHDAQSKEPIRILVIGDSIARGVGVSNTCYPNFPEVLSTIISKMFGGRPVYWSAYGEPGATTKWIVNKIEEQGVKRKMLLEEYALDESKHPPLPSLKEFYDLASHKSGNGGGSGATPDGTDTSSYDDIHEIQQKWVERLHYHQRLYETNPFGGYDIVFASAGVNDIKRALFPMVCRDDMDSGSSASGGTTKQYTKGFAGDLQRMYDNFIDSSGFEEVNGDENDEDFPSTCTVTENSSESQSGNIDHECQARRKGDRKMTRKVHVFLPSFDGTDMPVKLPSLVRWIGVQTTNMLDYMKKLTSENHPYEHLHTLPPGRLKDAIPYMEGTSALWDTIRDDEIKLQLVGVSTSECQNLVGEMRHFQANNIAPHEDMRSTIMVSSDAVHPNNAGYDFFARLLSHHIAEKLDM